MFGRAGGLTSLREFGMYVTTWVQVSLHGQLAFIVANIPICNFTPRLRLHPLLIAGAAYVLPELSHSVPHGVPLRSRLDQRQICVSSHTLLGEVFCEQASAREVAGLVARWDDTFRAASTVARYHEGSLLQTQPSRKPYLAGDQLKSRRQHSRRHCDRLAEPLRQYSAYPTGDGHRRILGEARTNETHLSPPVISMHTMRLSGARPNELSASCH